MLSFVRTKPYTKARTRFVYIHWNIWSNMWYAIRNLTNWKIKCRKGSLSSQKAIKGQHKKLPLYTFLAWSTNTLVSIEYLHPSDESKKKMKKKKLNMNKICAGHKWVYGHEWEEREEKMEMQKESWESQGEQIWRDKFLRTTLSFSSFDEFDVSVFNGLFQMQVRSGGFG